MISQEARVVFGNSLVGDVLFVLVQAATALILYTGGNTSFNGFPFLASFVAEDAFLPRWLTKRGHRLVFSNGIIVLAVLSCALLAGRRVQRQQPGPVLRARASSPRSRWPGSGCRGTSAGTGAAAGSTSGSSRSRPG